jgi:hypothetical protein
MSHKITITIETGNAAFDGDDEVTEVRRILEEVALRIERTGVSNADGQALVDLNGNTVGVIKVETQ